MFCFLFDASFIPSRHMIYGLFMLSDKLLKIHIFNLMKPKDHEVVWPRSVETSNEYVMWPMMKLMMISVICGRTFRSQQVGNIYSYLKRNIHGSESTAEQPHIVQWPSSQNSAWARVYACDKRMFLHCIRHMERERALSWWKNAWNFIDRQKINFNINYLTILDWTW